MNNLKDDIEKYLRGELSPQEMHLLEKKALDDPFLSDALEGNSLLNEQDYLTDLKALRHSLLERTEAKQRTIHLWYWPSRIAAGLLVLVVSGYIVYNLIGKKSTSDLALNNQEMSVQEQPAKTIQVDSTITSVPKNNPHVDKQKPTRMQQPVPVPRSETSHGPNSKVKPATAQSEFSAKNNEALEEVIVAEKKQEVTKAQEVSPQPMRAQLQNNERLDLDKESGMRKTSDLAANAPAAGAIVGENKKSTKFIHGKVIDAEDGSAMPGVNVTVKGSSTGTVTDAEGQYQLALDGDPKGDLVFSFIGMQSTEVPITNLDSINAQLAPDFAELSEIVVVGYGSINDGFVRTEENDFQPAEPVGGRKAFKNYLVTNARYPQQAIDNEIQGKVTVQFTVEATGILNDFRVLKGIGHGCDEEVIRLIKDGPKWTATKRNDIPLKGKVKVRLKFTLPN